MAVTPESLLSSYWGHNRFRPPQREIIAAVAAGQDVLALMPTGGGKSICFQIPGLLREGVAIVVTPLIALMEDQVARLRKRGIPALAVHSGMRHRELDVALDNAVYGNYKFLYVSPERLQTELFIERFRKMKVSLVAIDEAHCISQWGYDFRPAYLQIANLREERPDIPFIAVTATATAEVRSDIESKLQLRNPRVFQATFARPNLSLVVRKTEDKERKLLEILKKVPGPALVYVRSRRFTQDLARWLTKQGVPSLFYHAGLSYQDRTVRQEDWMGNRTRVMVATNAFGMGIDKPDVRVVVHLDLPESPESYFQEAGRAGRDGKQSYAALLYHESDAVNLTTKVEQSHPSADYLKKIYQSLANYFQIAVGGSMGESYDFDLDDFARYFSLRPAAVFSALQAMEAQGLISLGEAFYRPSRVHIHMDKQRLYEFQVSSARYDPLIKVLLRSYGATISSDFVQISETVVARQLQVGTAEVQDDLQTLEKLQVLSYVPASEKPQITFLTPRQDAAHLPIDSVFLKSRLDVAIKKAEVMIEYARQDHQCRMQVLLAYFGETDYDTCGRCDVCLARKKTESAPSVEDYRAQILKLLEAKAMNVDELEAAVEPSDRDVFIDVVRDLVDQSLIHYDEYWVLRRRQ